MKCNKEERLKYTERSKQIVENMSLEEKVHLMSGTTSGEELLDSFNNPEHHYNWIPFPAGGSERLNVPKMLFCDGPRGVVCGTGETTCFPVTMLRGATFDTELEERIGRAIGEETRAYGGNLFGGVCVNLPYNPGWGRSQEVYGEESFHLGAMGSALVRGVQNENVIACVKHYAFNSMEISRFKVSVDCDKRTEREVYLPHFKECIDAGAASVMSSYNLYKGTYCGHHDYLLNKVLKEEWEFDGFVISDFVFGVRDTVEAANGGQNIEMCCTEFFGPKLVKAVEDGLVSEEKINDSAIRIVRTLLAFNDADNKKYPENLLASKEHIELALEAAEKGITLIKNNDVLPLDRKAISRIAVIGTLGNMANIGDHGSSRVFPSYVVTPLEGIVNLAPECEVIYDDGQDMLHAKKLAESVDAVVFVVGYNHNDEGEYLAEEDLIGSMENVGGDRHSLELHHDEIRLLKEIGPINKNSVAVLIGGNTIMINSWENNVGSILMSYYPGMEGGTALAKILFGDVNPSGKLPFVLPNNECDLPSIEDWNTKSQRYNYYHGYAKLDKEGIVPRLPYGFGLSYTKFEVSEAVFTVDEFIVSGTCKVKNIGTRQGEEVIQLYIGFKNSSIDRPVKLLRGFERISLESGEEKSVTITCSIEKLKWYNPDTEAWELESMSYEVYVGTSSSENDLLKGSLNL